MLFWKIIIIILIQSTDSLVEPPIQVIWPWFNAIPVQLTEPEENRDQPTVEPIGPI